MGFSESRKLVEGMILMAKWMSVAQVKDKIEENSAEEVTAQLPGSYRKEQD